jgi:hypothetical protein
MQCPSCEYVFDHGSNFCPSCGSPLPIVVGASFPFGIRFPVAYYLGDDTPVAAYDVVVNAARLAPEYTETDRWHVARFDRLTVRQAADLYDLLVACFGVKSRHAVEHTIDGRQWFAGGSFWRCMADRLAGFVPERPGWNHPCQCHSLFGCLHAQARQPAHIHRMGAEVFVHGRHGFYAGRPGALERLNGKHEVVGADDYRRVMNVDEFHLDKGKIRAEVVALVKRAGAHRCPMFSWRRLDETIRRLPAIAKLDGGAWEFWHDEQVPMVLFKCYRAQGDRDRYVDPSSVVARGGLAISVDVRVERL